jgi:GAF domain-containing protein/HAMP domain-containing protein
MVVSDENILLVHSDDPQLISRAIMPLSEDQIAKLQQELALPATSENPYFVDLPELADYIAADNLGTGFSGVFQESRTYVLANREQANAVRMKTLPWTVVVAQQERVLLAPVAQMERGNMLTGIIAAVLSVIVGGAVARYLALPLIKLTDVARQVAAGDLSARATVTTHDEIGTLAGTFNQMAAQLNSLITGLEQRVADRTKALATSAEVSRRLSTILDQDLLVSEVVDQLQRAFSYYHVHIYLMDDSSTNLVLAGGTGEAGKEMLAKGHKIARGRGLVGRAAETGVPVLVPDVTRAQGWLPNPLLPESKSELAVPIIVGDQVLGVLDVQQNRVEGLKQEDADLLQSIANQVAVGLQNARAYAETQRRANREASISAINQRIQQTSSPEEALKVAVREVGRLLGTESTVRLSRKNEQHEPISSAGDGSNIGRAN